MPVLPSEIKFALSGGASNTSAASSIGGARSTLAFISDNVLNNLWNDTTIAESGTGSVKYRCIYIYNSNTTSSFGNATGPINATIWIYTNTPSPDDSVAIGIGTSAVNGTEQGPLTDENTTPSGVTFSSTAIDVATSLSLGVLPALNHRAVWIRRTVNTNTNAFNNDYYVLRVQGPAP